MQLTACRREIQYAETEEQAEKDCPDVCLQRGVLQHFTVHSIEPMSSEKSNNCIMGKTETYIQILG